MTLNVFLYLSAFLFMHQFASTYGKVYHPSTEKATFLQSLVKCKQIGYELASIESAEDNVDFLTSMINHTITGQPIGYWLSGAMLYDTSRYEYYWFSDGKMFDYTYWLPNEPSHGLEKYCVQWYFDPSIGQGWADYNCNIELPYICQG